MNIYTLAGFLLFAPSLPAPVVAAIQQDVALVALDVPSPVTLDGLFAPATEGLALAWPEDSEGITVLDVVSAYGLATGQRLAINQETRQLLGQTRAPLDRATSVPAPAVQGFVEALLRSSNCLLTIDRSSEPRLIGVHSLLTQGRNGIRARAMSIDSARSDVLRGHPAVLFSTVVNLPNVDVRQMVNALRTLITDANTSQMLPAGSTNSIILIGFGPMVADRVEELRAVDAASVKPDVTVSHELVRLQNADAANIAPLVEHALTTSRELRRPGSNGQQGPQQQRAIHVSVLANSRLNGLLVTCRSEDLDEARAVIAQLDVK
ncbi:MAG: hypothetical protein ACJA0P_000523 [Planctomycetota bacterium]|jgi:hypothetical protein